MPRKISLVVSTEDVVNTTCDTVILPYGQMISKMATVFCQKYKNLAKMLERDPPSESEYRLLNVSGTNKQIQFVVVGTLSSLEFTYTQAREFTSHALSILTHRNVATNKLLCAFPGRDGGLDEVELFESAIAGIIDGTTNKLVPKELESIVIPVENTRLEELFRLSLSDLLELPSNKTVKPLTFDSINATSHRLRTVGYSSVDKKRAFVAMPFDLEMEDVFLLGIRPIVTEVGMLCERADTMAFTGEIHGWIKKRMATAEVVIVDLSQNNCNVYLELGYAWGRNIPTILISREGAEIAFDAQNQRRISYVNISNLKQKLRTEMRGLGYGRSNI